MKSETYKQAQLNAMELIYKKGKVLPYSLGSVGTGDQCRRSQNGFYTPMSPISPSAEEFISSTPNIGVKKI